MNAPTPVRPRVFSGIQPSGELHIGNWLGAVRTWADQVAAQKEDLFFCIVDAHAVTVEYDPAELHHRIWTMAADLVACGLDPERELVPLRTKRAELESHPDKLRQALGDGAVKARRIAVQTMREVRPAMGLGSGASAP